MFGPLKSFVKYVWPLVKFCIIHIFMTPDQACPNGDNFCRPLAVMVCTGAGFATTRSRLTHYGGKLIGNNGPC
jgi:hypothetical protein